MTKNVIIIFGLAGIVLLYAVVDMLLPKNTGADPAADEMTLQKIEPVLSEISVKLGLQKMTQAELSMIELMRDPWGEDPFIDEMPKIGGGKAGADEDVYVPPESLAELTYDGYMQCDGRIVAFISGWEYEVGDVFAAQDFCVAAITVEAVTLDDIATGNSAVLKLEQDESAFDFL